MNTHKDRVLSLHVLTLFITLLFTPSIQSAFTPQINAPSNLQPLEVFIKTSSGIVPENAINNREVSVDPIENTIKKISKKLRISEEYREDMKEKSVDPIILSIMEPIAKQTTREASADIEQLEKAMKELANNQPENAINDPSWKEKNKKLAKLKIRMNRLNGTNEKFAIAALPLLAIVETTKLIDKTQQEVKGQTNDFIKNIKQELQKPVSEQAKDFIETAKELTAPLSGIIGAVKQKLKVPKTEQPKQPVAIIEQQPSAPITEQPAPTIEIPKTEPVAPVIDQPAQGIEIPKQEPITPSAEQQMPIISTIKEKLITPATTQATQIIETIQQKLSVHNASLPSVIDLPQLPEPNQNDIPTITDDRSRYALLFIAASCALIAEGAGYVIYKKYYEQKPASRFATYLTSLKNYLAHPGLIMGKA